MAGASSDVVSGHRHHMAAPSLNARITCGLAPRGNLANTVVSVPRSQVLAVAHGVQVGAGEHNPCRREQISTSATPAL